MSNTNPSNDFSKTALGQINLNLDNLSLADLRQHQQAVLAKVKEIEQRERSTGIARIHEIAASVGLSVREVINFATGSDNKVAVKFRHPVDESKTWTGRGRQPGWVNTWVNGGGNMDALRV